MLDIVLTIPLLVELFEGTNSKMFQFFVFLFFFFAGGI